MALNPKRAAFVREYLIDLNATQAAIRAGYSQKGAGQKGHELLKIVEVQAAIQAAQADLAEHALVTAQDVVKGLRAEAESYGEGTSHSARVAAWAHLGKYLGMFTERQEVNVTGDIVLDLTEAPNAPNRARA